jgi:hypothetical protein
VPCVFWLRVVCVLCACLCAGAPRRRVGGWIPHVLNLGDTAAWVCVVLCRDTRAIVCVSGQEGGKLVGRGRGGSRGAAVPQRERERSAPSGLGEWIYARAWWYFQSVRHKVLLGPGERARQRRRGGGHRYRGRASLAARYPPGGELLLLGYTLLLARTHRHSDNNSLAILGVSPLFGGRRRGLGERGMGRWAVRVAPLRHVQV